MAVRASGCVWVEGGLCERRKYGRLIGGVKEELCASSALVWREAGNGKSFKSFKSFDHSIIRALRSSISDKNVLAFAFSDWVGHSMLALTNINLTERKHTISKRETSAYLAVATSQDTIFRTYLRACETLV